MLVHVCWIRLLPFFCPVVHDKSDKTLYKEGRRYQVHLPAKALTKLLFSTLSMYVFLCMCEGFHSLSFKHSVKRVWQLHVKSHQLSHMLINPMIYLYLLLFLLRSMFTFFFAHSHHFFPQPFFHRFTICHKTEVVKNTLNPVWQAFKIPVRALCNGDYDR